MSKTITGATKEKPFANSLGMKFVPVPGTKVLFSIWDTRVRDYRVYELANPGVDASWKSPSYKRGSDGDGGSAGFRCVLEPVTPLP